MSPISFSLSAAQQNRLMKMRNKTQQFLGAETYQNSVAKIIPHLRQTMTKHKCGCAISAVRLALSELGSDAKDPAIQRLFTCAAVDLAQAS